MEQSHLVARIRAKHVARGRLSLRDVPEELGHELRAPRAGLQRTFLIALLGCRVFLAGGLEQLLELKEQRG